MIRINKDQNCYRALIVNVKNFISVLLDLNKRLESIQKNLQQYLEAKRTNFPRFFFLSNDDLLEIIGQAKDPTPINKHIKKIYEGINELEATSTGKGANKTWTITKLIAPDKEEVDLQGRNVTVEAKVENWLKQLTSTMKETLKRKFQ